jgi:hypothetical protein
MGKLFDGIDEELQSFIEKQKMFFVATAPMDNVGHINLSPKCLDSLRILDPHTVAYADATGSGIETVAHLKENGRIVIMLCAFQGPPRIVRLHGHGQVVESRDEEFSSLAARLPVPPGTRAVIRVELNRISNSCGFGVPLYRHEGERAHLKRWAEKKGEEGLREYQEKNNLSSIDGLPGLGDESVRTEPRSVFLSSNPSKPSDT